MTERKPPDISITSWIDRQIHEATERGAFDNLPGAGKPLPDRAGAGGQAWLRDYLSREGVSAEDLLPVPLKLRKEIERLTGTVQELPSEQQVRDFAAGLNQRIMEWRRFPQGPQVFLPRVDEETVVRQWREGRSAIAPESPPAPVRPDQDSTPRSRWWHRRSRGGSERSPR